MFRVLVVDDEKYAREGIINALNWEHHGCVVTGEAQNGKQAYQFIKTKPVDIVIADIKMPIMNGIELQKRISEENIAVHTIFLTAYDEFDFAKQAIRSDADDYILKPLDPKELEATITRVCSKLRQEDTRDEKKRELQFYNLRNNRLKTNEDFAVHFQKYKQDFRHYRLMILHGINREWTKELLTNDNTLLVSRMNTAVYTLFFYNNPSEYANAKQQIIQDVIQSKLSFGESGEKGTLYQIYDSYLEAQKDLMDNFFRNTMNETDFSTFSRGKIELEKDLRGLFYSRLAPREFELSFSRLLYSYLHGALSKTRNYSYLLTNVFTRLQELQFQLMIKTDGGIQQYRKALYEEGQPLDRISFIIEYAIAIKKQLFVRLKKPSFVKVLRIKKYIDNNTASEIDLETLANKNNLSKNYLCTLFKKYMGKTIVQYIIENRIHNAKESIKNDDKKMYQIAYDTGFNDPSYFNKKFKEIVGISPFEYKKTVSEGV